jgi:hypothetical protein
MSKEKIIMFLVSMMLERLSGDVVKGWVDAGLDMLEDSIEKDGKEDWKDKVILPFIALARDAFSIPDND